MTTLTGSLIVTTQGRDELLAGTFEPTEIAVGTSSWTPDASSSALLAEASRFDVEGTVVQQGDDARLNLQGIDEAAVAYAVKEFALFDADGDCLVIYSQATTIITKAVSSALVLSLQLVITDADAIDVTLGDTTFQLPAATKVLAGIVELATPTEVVDGVDDSRAVTPAGLAALAATVSRAGLLELATGPEVQAGTEAAKAIAPSTLATLTAAATRRGLVELATVAEVEAGTDAERAVTPAGLAAMVESGEWTPTVVENANVSNVTINHASYTRVGDVVSFSVRGLVDITAMDTQVTWRLSPPVDSDFGSTDDVAGVLSCHDSDHLVVGGYVAAYTSSDDLIVYCRVTQEDGGGGSVTSTTWAISGHYKVT